MGYGYLIKFRIGTHECWLKRISGPGWVYTTPTKLKAHSGQYTAMWALASFIARTLNDPDLSIELVTHLCEGTISRSVSIERK